MNVKRTILFLTAAALLTGCFKDVSTTTNYVIKPLVQDLSGDPYLALEGVKAYAFAADTAFYTVASYADALEGVASLKGNPSERLSPSSRPCPTSAKGLTDGSRCRCRTLRKWFWPSIRSIRSMPTPSRNWPKIFRFCTWRCLSNRGRRAFPTRTATGAITTSSIRLPPTSTASSNPRSRARRAAPRARYRALKAYAFAARHHGVVHRLVRRCRGGQDHVEGRRFHSRAPTPTSRPIRKRASAALQDAGLEPRR